MPKYRHGLRGLNILLCPCLTSLNNLESFQQTHPLEVSTLCTESVDTAAISLDIHSKVALPHTTSMFKAELMAHHDSKIVQQYD